MHRRVWEIRSPSLFGTTRFRACHLQGAVPLVHGVVSVTGRCHGTVAVIRPWTL